MHCWDRLSCICATLPLSAQSSISHLSRFPSSPSNSLSHRPRYPPVCIGTVAVFIPNHFEMWHSADTTGSFGRGTGRLRYEGDLDHSSPYAHRCVGALAADLSLRLHSRRFFDHPWSSEVVMVKGMCNLFYYMWNRCG